MSGTKNHLSAALREKVRRKLPTDFFHCFLMRSCLLRLAFCVLFRKCAKLRKHPLCYVENDECFLYTEYNFFEALELCTGFLLARKSEIRYNIISRFTMKNGGKIRGGNAVRIGILFRKDG